MLHKKLIQIFFKSVVIGLTLFVFMLSGSSVMEKSPNGDPIKCWAQSVIAPGLSEIFFQRQKRHEHICYTLMTQDMAFTSILHKNMKRLYVLTEANVAWCTVFKAGSTTIIKSFHEIWNDTEVSKRRKKNFKQSISSLGILNAIAPQYNSIQFQGFQSTNGTLTFVVTRHPFHRLVSAFRDKLERLHSVDAEHYKEDFYYHTYGKKMVEKYRKMALKKFGESFFEEKNNFGAPVPPKGLRIKELPTFWEFIQFIRNERLVDMDEHWMPITNYCGICAVHYDYIIKYENFATEMPFLWKKLGHSVSEERWSSPDHTYEESKNLTELYFSLLTDEDILDLGDIYRRDFDIFGYDFKFRNVTILPKFE